MEWAGNLPPLIPPDGLEITIECFFAVSYTHLLRIGLQDQPALLIQLDEAELRKLIGSRVDIDLNRMLAEKLPAGDSLEVPLREIRIKDVAPALAELDEEGRLVLEPDAQVLESLGLDLERVAAALPGDWPVAVEEGRIVVTPVSYTHLDVYKRQVIGSMVAVSDMVQPSPCLLYTSRCV